MLTNYALYSMHLYVDTICELQEILMLTQYVGYSREINTNKL
jgi:hypothetical protein